MNSSNPTRLLCRPDTRSGQGLGHLMRLCALAQIARKSFSCSLLIDPSCPNPARLGIADYFDEIIAIPGELPLREEPKWLRSIVSSHAIVALDGYCFSTSYQRTIRSYGLPIIYVDDFASGYYCADIVLNHAPGAETLSYNHDAHTKLCLGTIYRLLRPNFSPFKHEPSEDTGVLVICFGGTGPLALIKQSVSAADAVGFSEIHVVLGSEENKDTYGRQLSKQVIVHGALSAEDLAALFRRATGAVLSASTTALEAASIGLPFVTGYFVNNQTIIYKGLTDSGAALPLGCLVNCSQSSQISKIEKLQSASVRKRMLSRQRTLFQEQKEHPLLSQLTDLSNMNISI